MLTPNNRLAITRVRTAAPISPARMPINVNCIPWRTTRARIFSAPRTQRDQNADIVCALGHQVRHHAVEAHGGQQQREPRECTQHCAGEALARKRIMQAVLHGTNAIDDDRRIDCVDLADDGSSKVPRSSDDERATRNVPSVRPLLHGEISSDLAVGIQTVLFDHSHDANNGDGLFGIEPEMFSDGVIVRPESLREFLVNDGDLRRFEAVLHPRRSGLRPKESASSGNSPCLRCA